MDKARKERIPCVFNRRATQATGERAGESVEGFLTQHTNEQTTEPGGDGADGVPVKVHAGELALGAL